MLNPKRSQLEIYYEVDRRRRETLRAIVEIQLGPNPVTREEWQRTQARRPERYSHIPYVLPRAA